MAARRWLVGGSCFAAVLAFATCAAAAPDARLDRVFAGWSGPSSPGCALAVVHGGALVYARGYGTANLELGAPILPRTVFDIGSVSKQFTAMSILLLAGDGKLSLDDDIHRTLPELPAYGYPVTLRHMLHHLSGLKSYTDLFDLAGVPEIDRTTDDDALALIARQRTLNFPPGTAYLYSDTNYFLLAQVVRRVSGQTLREFARRRIFGPLGMNDTHFNDDPRRIVPRRATGYAPRAGGGFEIDMSNFEELGDGSVMTTVLDLARWSRNFDTAAVGGPRVVAQLQEPGVRADGSRSPYAMGLILDTYRGVPRVQHTGEWVGYRSSFLRFPTRQLAVIVLCNSVGSLNPLALSEQVADVVLKERAASATVSVAPASATAGADATAYAGRYWNAETFAFRRFVATGDVLRLSDTDADGGEALRPLGGGVFEAGDSTTRYRFRATASGVTVRAEDDDGDAVMLDRTADPAPAARSLEDDAGTYYSEDLGVAWTLQVRRGRLFRTQWLFPTQELEPILPDTFQGDLSEGRYVLTFIRDPAGRAQGFRVGTRMVRPLEFSRCEAASGRGAGIAATCRAGPPAH